MIDEVIYANDLAYNIIIISKTIKDFGIGRMH